VRSIADAELTARQRDPRHELPRLVAERLGLGAITGFEQVRYFHGTRTLDPESYRRRGLLPLPEVLEDIWDGLGEVAADLLSTSDLGQLREFIEAGGGGHGGYQYRSKTTDWTQHGPFGEYIREHFLRPHEVTAHDYLRTPELVEDIAYVAADCFGVDLLARFSACATPCIVVFEMPVVDEESAVSAACWYVHAAANGEATTINARGGFHGDGVGVPAAAIRCVEVIDEG
jgi:hypothetical protein